jgi:hypothetical protein
MTSGNKSIIRKRKKPEERDASKRHPTVSAMRINQINPAHSSYS